MASSIHQGDGAMEAVRGGHWQTGVMDAWMPANNDLTQRGTEELSDALRHHIGLGVGHSNGHHRYHSMGWLSWRLLRLKLFSGEGLGLIRAPQ
jgi:hypothetical protein